MTQLAKLRFVAATAVERPALGRWYLRNRLRVATLGFERRSLAGFSRFARGVTLKPTMACNLRCKMCRFAANGSVSACPTEALPLDAWIALADDLGRFRPYVSITGGEPLLYPYAVELIHHIKRRRMRCTLTTNGTLLARQAAALMEAPPDILLVSLDGPPEVHNHVRGSATAYERTVEGVAAVRELKVQLRRTEPGIVINCTVTGHSYQHAAAVLDIAQELGVDVLNYQHQWSLTDRMVAEHNAMYGHCHGLLGDNLGASDPPPIDAQQVVDTVRGIRRRAASLDGRFMVTFHPDLSDSEVLRWYSDPHTWVRRRPAACAWMNTNILPNGNVEPCPGLVCGNVTQQKFPDIWNGPAYRAHRRRLAEAGDFPVCVRCCSYFRRD